VDSGVLRSAAHRAWCLVQPPRRETWRAGDAACGPQILPTKKNPGTPVVGGSEYQKGLGSDLFFRYFFIVFFNSPHQETPKNVIKQNQEKVGFGFLVEFFCKTFFVVFLNSHR
jgi:hypothetical protein